MILTRSCYVDDCKTRVAIVLPDSARYLQFLANDFCMGYTLLADQLVCMFASSLWILRAL